MSRIHNCSDGYLGRQIVVSFLSVVGIVVVVSVWGFWFDWSFDTGNKGRDLALTLTVFGMVLVGVRAILDAFGRRARTFASGRRGEQRILADLKNLSDDYVVFYDIQSKRGNVDFVVIGPEGVFCIEVKNHKGTFYYDEQAGRLRRKWRPIPENKRFIKQSKSGATWIKGLINESGFHLSWVHAVVLFAHDQAQLMFGYRQIDTTYVIGRELLSGLFAHVAKKHETRLRSSDIHEIESILLSIDTRKT